MNAGFFLKKTKTDDVVNISCSVSNREIDKVSKWLIPSLIKQKEIKKINLYLFNYDGTKDLVYNGPSQVDNISIKEFNKFEQCGFGESHNFVFKEINPSDNFLIINPDVYLHEYCIYEMLSALKNDTNVGCVEARQLPFEHPKKYDLNTMETSWASNFCVMMKPDVFSKIGGYDENFWMYCEDVDISWRILIQGYKVIYCPNAVAYHYTGAYFEYSPSRFYLEHYWGARNFIYLSYKFFGLRGEIKAKRLLNGMNYPDNFKKEIIYSFEKAKEKSGDYFYKKNNKKIKELYKMIKVTSFNQYHENF